MSHASHPSPPPSPTHTQNTQNTTHYPRFCEASGQIQHVKLFLLRCRQLCKVPVIHNHETCGARTLSTTGTLGQVCVCVGGGGDAMGSWDTRGLQKRNNAAVSTLKAWCSEPLRCKQSHDPLVRLCSFPRTLDLTCTNPRQSHSVETQSGCFPHPPSRAP